MEPQKIVINEEQCDPYIMTYGDVIRNMDNLELAIFLTQMGADIELGSLAVMRAKSYMHRIGGDKKAVENPAWEYMYRFMQKHIDETDSDFAEVWGIDNWQDLMRWVVKGFKNFGMNVKY